MVKSTLSRRPVQRLLRVISPVQADGSGIIRITCGKVVEEYRLQTFDAYQGEGTGVSLTKENGETYHVCLATTDESINSCDCKGFQHHNHCKHFDAMRVLAGRGELHLPIVDFVAMSEQEMESSLALAGW